MAKTQVLLIEDDPDDIRRIRETLQEDGAPVLLHVVPTDDAAAHVHGLDEVGPRPALILLSLQPDHDDHRLLQTIKASPMLRHTPIVVLTRSRKISDMLQSIDLYASSCVLKPNIDDDFRRAIRAIRRFWLELTVLPLPGVPR